MVTVTTAPARAFLILARALVVGVGALVADVEAGDGLPSGKLETICWRSVCQAAMLVSGHCKLQHQSRAGLIFLPLVHGSRFDLALL